MEQKQRNIHVLGLDCDGCVFNDDFHDDFQRFKKEVSNGDYKSDAVILDKFMELLMASNQDLVALINGLVKIYKNDFELASFSNRVSLGLDYFNASQNKTLPWLVVLPVLAKKLGVRLNPVLVVDDQEKHKDELPGSTLKYILTAYAKALEINYQEGEQNNFGDFAEKILPELIKDIAINKQQKIVNVFDDEKANEFELEDDSLKDDNKISLINSILNSHQLEEEVENVDLICCEDREKIITVTIASLKPYQKKCVTILEYNGKFKEEWPGNQKANQKFLVRNTEGNMVFNKAAMQDTDNNNSDNDVENIAQFLKNNKLISMGDRNQFVIF